MKKILAIDGGGIRGIIPAVVLIEIEKRTGSRIADLFDLIAGTSTGGILSLGLVKPRSDQSKIPHYTAEELLKFYFHEGEQIFPSTAIDKWLGRKSLVGNLQILTGAKYSHEPLESLLDRYFEDVLMSQALTP
ncbi:MAG: patatin, partial [Leptolyngbya sp. SIO4C1]|nr:patatin [Leptolyngbya sp. SIO4C1]